MEPVGKWQFQQLTAGSFVVLQDLDIFKENYADRSIHPSRHVDHGCGIICDTRLFREAHRHKGKNALAVRACLESVAQAVV